MTGKFIQVGARGRSVVIGRDRPDYRAGDPPALFFDAQGLLLIPELVGPKKIKYHAYGYEQILGVDVDGDSELYEHGGFLSSLAGGIIGSSQGVAGAFAGGALGSALGSRQDVQLNGLWVNVMVDPASPKQERIMFLNGKLKSGNASDRAEFDELSRRVDECVAKVNVAMDMADEVRNR